MTSLRIEQIPPGMPFSGCYTVWATRNGVNAFLGSAETRKEAEECFKQYLREIAVQDGSDFIFC